MREKIEYLIVLFFIYLFKFIPLNVAYFIFDKLGILLFYILKSRKKIALLNLRNAYSDLTDNEIYNIAKENYRSIARSVTEILFLLNDRVNIDDFVVNKNEAIEKLNDITKNNKNGIIFTTAHFGNWEFLAHFIAKVGFPMLAIGREGNNGLIEQNLTLPFRQKFGNLLVYKHEAMMKMLKTIKSGKNVGILIDQKAGNINSVNTTFFQNPCTTSKSIASLKLKYNPLIILAFLRRNKSGKYEILIENTPNFTFTNDKNQDIINITQTINNIFEKVVRTAPQQWFWMHNRWKMD